MTSRRRRGRKARHDFADLDFNELAKHPVINNLFFGHLFRDRGAARLKKAGKL